MVILNVEEILKKQGKKKAWLCDKLDISQYNLNKALKPGKKSISYKYLEGFTKYLECTFDELLTVIEDKNEEEK